MVSTPAARARSIAVNASDSDMSTSSPSTGIACVAPSALVSRTTTRDVDSSTITCAWLSPPRETVWAPSTVRSYREACLPLSSRLSTSVRATIAAWSAGAKPLVGRAPKEPVSSKTSKVVWLAAGGTLEGALRIRHRANGEALRFRQTARRVVVGTGLLAHDLVRVLVGTDGADVEGLFLHGMLSLSRYETGLEWRRERHPSGWQTRPPGTRRCPHASSRSRQQCCPQVCCWPAADSELPRPSRASLQLEGLRVCGRHAGSLR